MNIDHPKLRIFVENPEIDDTENFMKFVMEFPDATTGDRQDCKKLFNLWKAVIAEGGFEKVYEYDIWNDLKQKHHMLCKDIDVPLFDCFRENLLASYVSNKFKDPNLIKKFNINALQRPLVFEADQTVDYYSEKFRNATVVVIKDSFNRWNLNKSLYSEGHITKKYGSRKIRIIDQNPLGNSFKVRSKEMAQKNQSMTIKEYYAYQKNLENITIFSKDLPKRVKFAVNVDINSWGDIMEDLELKLPSQLLFKSEDDILSFLRQDIEGVTIPQIYLKVAGCWTGGHEENLRIRAFNINTGEGDVEWYFIDPEFVPLFRKVVKEISRIDIHKEEGLWYTDLLFCLKHNIPITKYIQKPGDSIVLKPGTLHWVRSLENTSNVAWNLGLYEFQQLQMMMSRYSINNEIHFNNLLPVKTFFLDLLNNCWKRFDEQSLE
jgi:hypothetical protein